MARSRDGKSENEPHISLTIFMSYSVYLISWREPLSISLSLSQRIKLVKVIKYSNTFYTCNHREEKQILNRTWNWGGWEVKLFVTPSQNCNYQGKLIFIHYMLGQSRPGLLKVEHSPPQRVSLKSVEGNPETKACLSTHWELNAAPNECFSGEIPSRV